MASATVAVQTKALLVVIGSGTERGSRSFVGVVVVAVVVWDADTLEFPVPGSAAANAVVVFREEIAFVLLCVCL